MAVPSSLRRCPARAGSQSAVPTSPSPASTREAFAPSASPIQRDRQPETSLWYVKRFPSGLHWGAAKLAFSFASVATTAAGAASKRVEHAGIGLASFAITILD